MRTRFAAIPTREVTLSREDGQTATFTLTAIPIGFHAMLQVEMPEPPLFVNGKPAGADQTKMGLYWHRFSMILIAKALEPSGELGTRRDDYPKTPKGWESYADAVEEEFREANFTQADISVLAEAVTSIGQRAQGPDSGNSAFPPRGG